MAGFYGRFIKHLSSIAAPLHALKRKNARFVWGDTQRSAFERLQEGLSTPPVLQIPDFSQKFTLVCDASDVAISTVLNQEQGEELAPVAYSSRLFTLAERRYSVHETECLAVVYSCKKYRSYLEHKEFCHFTDNKALVGLLRHAKELGRIGRWVLRLAPFKFKVCHVSGKSNVVANCLTRQYDNPSADATFAGLVLQHLPEAFQSIREYQKKDPFCKDLYPKVVQGGPAANVSVQLLPP
jgi:hypothetical protein